MSIPLNQILFGPPGTGKTFNSINLALEILGEPLDGKSREEVKAVFQSRVDEGRIVFTTFHQSMSYEDFIEGIKPIEPRVEGHPVIYRVVDGVFKRLCKGTARFARGERFGRYIIESVSPELLVFRKPQGGQLPISVEMIHELVRYLDETGSGPNGRLTDVDRSRYPLLEPHLINGYDGLIPFLVERVREGRVHDGPRVLIIDEINRGNVSNIFGELITLIEEDKRLGRPEALRTTLPYSKEKFGVPADLYIIGTMNTADRSVEALDVALRRRFSFREMRPDSTLIATSGPLSHKGGTLDGIPLPALLETINSRLERLLDKDHQIGHSYLLAVSTLDDLRVEFQNRILPLLQEYFFGDHGKIGLVLGKGFLESVTSAGPDVFAEFDEYDGSDFAERPIYRFKRVTEMDDADFVDALGSLMRV